MFIIRLPLPAGDMFYTGRAGNGFMSDDLSEAFTYRSESEARIKARRLNVARLGAKFEVSRKPSKVTA